MEMSEIIENIYPEDKAMVAVSCECTFRYVDMVLYGDRKNQTETAKKIIEKLERLAAVNKASKAEKAQLIAA